MMIYREIKRLINYGLKHTLFTKDDEIFMTGPAEFICSGKAY